MRATSPPVPLTTLDPASATEAWALDRAASPDAWSLPVWREELGRGDRRYLGVHTDRLIGLAGWADLAGEAHLMSVVVADRERRRGLGARLVAGVLADAAAHGASAVTLEVRRSNTAARALYRRAGFVDAGVRPRYYADGEDAVVLWRR